MKRMLLAALVCVSCGSAPPLQHAAASPEALARAVLDALARNDRAALERLALSEREFRDHVWPLLPAARPGRNLPFSYVWGELRQKSTTSLANVLLAYGGERHELAGIEFDDITDYATFRVHRAATLRVRDAHSQERLIRICGSMIQKGAAWKVFSYVVD